MTIIVNYLFMNVYKDSPFNSNELLSIIFPFFASTYKGAYGISNHYKMFTLEGFTANFQEGWLSLY